MSENEAQEIENTTANIEVTQETTLQTEQKAYFQAHGNQVSSRLDIVSRTEFNAAILKIQEKTGYTCTSFKEMLDVLVKCALDGIAPKAAEVKMIPTPLQENQRIIEIDEETQEMINDFVMAIGGLETPSHTDIFKIALATSLTSSSPEPIEEPENVVKIEMNEREHYFFKHILDTRKKRQLVSEPTQVAKELIFNLDNLLNPKLNTGLINKA